MENARAGKRAEPLAARLAISLSSLAFFEGVGSFSGNRRHQFSLRFLLRGQILGEEAVGKSGEQPLDRLRRTLARGEICGLGPVFFKATHVGNRRAAPLLGGRGQTLQIRLNSGDASAIG